MREMMHRGILAKAVQDDVKRLACGPCSRSSRCRWRLPRRQRIRDPPGSRSTRVSSRRSMAAEVAVAETDLALVRDGAGNAERLKTHDRWLPRRQRRPLQPFLMAIAAPSGVGPARRFQRRWAGCRGRCAATSMPLSLRASLSASSKEAMPYSAMQASILLDSAFVTFKLYHLYCTSLQITFCGGRCT